MPLEPSDTVNTGAVPELQSQTTAGVTGSAENRQVEYIATGVPAETVAVIIGGAALTVSLTVKVLGK